MSRRFCSFALAAWLVGCGTSNPPAVITPGVKVLADADAQSITVTPNTLSGPATLASLSGLKLGDIVASGHQEGFLRRVIGTSTQGGTITVQTQQPALDEVVQSGSLSTSFDTTQLSPTTDPLVQGLSGSVDLSGKTIYTNTNGLGEIRIGEGSFNWNTDLSLDAEYDDGLKSFSLSSTGTITANATVEVSIDHVSIVEEGELWRYRTIKTVLIGELPVPMVITFSLLLKVEGSVETGKVFQLGYQGSGMVSAGVAYDGSELTPSGASGLTFMPAKPKLTDIGATFEIGASLIFRVDVIPYAIAGPRIEFEGGVKYEITQDKEQCPWKDVATWSAPYQGTIEPKLGVFTHETI